MFKPTQFKTTIIPNTFTAQDAGIYSNAELDQFWKRIEYYSQKIQVQPSNYLENR